MPIAVVATESGRRRSLRTSFGVIAVKPSGNDAGHPYDESAGEVLPVESYRLAIFERSQHCWGTAVVRETRTAPTTASLRPAMSIESPTSTPRRSSTAASPTLDGARPSTMVGDTTPFGS